jgi:hypothetical protein
MNIRKAYKISRKCGDDFSSFYMSFYLLLSIVEKALKSLIMVNKKVLKNREVVKP